VNQYSSLITCITGATAERARSFHGLIHKPPSLLCAISCHAGRHPGNAISWIAGDRPVRTTLVTAAGYESSVGGLIAYKPLRPDAEFARDCSRSFVAR
jgi:hypothetical protein